jgi:hypothetical protein
MAEYYVDEAGLCTVRAGPRMFVAFYSPTMCTRRGLNFMLDSQLEGKPRPVDLPEGINVVRHAMCLLKNYGKSRYGVFTSQVTAAALGSTPL